MLRYCVGGRSVKGSSQVKVSSDLNIPVAVYAEGSSQVKGL